MSLSAQDVCDAIANSLTSDLLNVKWKKMVSPDDVRVSGHCAIAAGAFYYLAGGHRAGMMPYVCSYYERKGRYVFAVHPDKSVRQTHWWVQGPLGAARGSGEVYDPTADQYAQDLPDGFPYEMGRGTGLQHPKQIPSIREKIIIDRVREQLGREALAEFRQQQIKLYAAAVKATNVPVSEILRRKPEKSVWPRLERFQAVSNDPEL